MNKKLTEICVSKKMLIIGESIISMSFWMKLESKGVIQGSWIIGSKGHTGGKGSKSWELWGRRIYWNVRVRHFGSFRLEKGPGFEIEFQTDTVWEFIRIKGSKERKGCWVK